MNMQKFNREPILKFDQYFQTQRLSSFSLKGVQYIPIAESILANDNIYLETEQKSVLEFIVERQIPIYKWVLLKEDLYTDAMNYIQTNIIEPSTKAIKGAINWVVELGSDLISAIGSVVDKVMEGVQTAWDS